MRFSLIPREEKFFEYFLMMSDQLKTGARLLEEMLSGDSPVYDKAHEIKEVEHKCDFLTHDIIKRLNSTFVTPIDREDIYALARSLDDVMDAIDHSAVLLPLYKIGEVRYGARELARVISSQVEQIRLCMQALEKRTGVLERSVEINKLENEADRIHQRAISELFEMEKDPITVLKWKEILDFLEDATDRCEDVANLLETIVVKNG